MVDEDGQIARELAQSLILTNDVEKLTAILESYIEIQKRRAKTPLQSAEDCVPVIAFLFYLMKDKGPNYTYGARTVSEAFTAICNISGLDRELVIERFGGLDG